jgi:hypothetical protein
MTLGQMELIVPLMHAGAVLVLQPSNETFSTMMHDIQMKKENKDGADQGFLTNHFSDLLDRPMFHPPADSSRLNGLFRLPLGYQMDASYFYLKLKWNAQTRRITFTEAPAKYTSNTSATFRSNLTSAANGSGSSIDTCATLCSIRCKLDQRNFEHCAGREDSLVNLLDGHRSFVVSVNTFNGVQFSAQYNWTVGMWYLFAA